MDPKQNVSSMQKTPAAKTDKEKTPIDKKQTGSEMEKEKAMKKIEEARKENREKQERDLPRFEIGKGENEITTSKDTYELVAILGQGSFGCVYSCIRQSDKTAFALKCESVHTKRQMLPHEANVLLALNLLKSPHFVEMIDHGQIKGRFQFVVIRLVGQNLWDVRVELREKRFGLATSINIGIQTLAGLRDLHRVGYLHRDIKPPNFCIGRPNEDTFHTVFILDFGLCRKIALKGKDIRLPRKECAFRGTTRYASIAAHDSKEQSRKDDIESWWYMLAEFIIIDIPWKKIRGTDRDAVRAAKWRLREDNSYMKLLFHKCCYQQMHTILLYLDSLEYENIPDYDFVYRQIIAAASVHKVDLDSAPDWDPDAKKYKGPEYKEKVPYIVKELE